MDDFLLRFGTCTSATDASQCHFSVVREGLIVALLSIGTLIGALLGARFVSPIKTPASTLQTSHLIVQSCRSARTSMGYDLGMLCLHRRRCRPTHFGARVATICRRPSYQWYRSWCSQCSSTHGELLSSTRMNAAMMCPSVVPS